MAELKILGICGSLRTGSYSRAALQAAQELAPENVTIEIVDIGNLPLFNQDFERDLPDVVKELKERIRAADAILFSSPEYNYSIPGVLKNAIDWASRPYTENAWEGKPVAVMGASTGMLGTARMQYHLRQTFVFLDMHALNKPEVMIPGAADKVDRSGTLTDQATRDKIKELVEALADWARKLEAASITAES